jgi:outer membrane lipoprotein-sorting protein
MKKRIIYLVLIIALSCTTDLYALTGDEAVARFKSRMFGIGTMTGTISWSHSSGLMYTGNFTYMSPGKIYVTFSRPPGKSIISNGRTLWVYNSESKVCTIQDLSGGGSGGIAGIVRGYSAIATSSKTGYTIKLKNNEKRFTNITLLVDSSFLLRRVMLKTGTGETLIINLTDVNTGVDIRRDIFDFNIPENVQIIKNAVTLQ